MKWGQFFTIDSLVSLVCLVSLVYLVYLVNFVSLVYFVKLTESKKGQRAPRLNHRSEFLLFLRCAWFSCLSVSISFLCLSVQDETPCQPPGGWLHVPEYALHPPWVL